MDTAEIIKAVIEAKKISKKELGFSLKSSEKKVERWLTGEKQPTKKKMKLLAAFCGVSYEELLSGTVFSAHTTDSSKVQKKNLTLSETEYKNLADYKKFSRKRNPLSTFNKYSFFFVSALATTLLFLYSFYSVSKVFLFKTNLASPVIFSFAVATPVLLMLMQYAMCFPLIKNAYYYKRGSLTKVSVPFVLAGALFSLIPFALNYLHLFPAIAVLGACALVTVLSNIATSEKLKAKYEPRFNFIFYVPTAVVVAGFIAMIYFLPERTKGTSAFYETASPLISVLFCLILSAFNTGRCFANYCKTSYTKRFFHPLPLEKNISKKRIAFCVIPVAFAVVFSAALLFVAPKNASEVFLTAMKYTFLNGDVKPAKAFPDYNVRFENNEAYTVLLDDFTIEIPKNCKLKEDSEHNKAYVSKNVEIIISTSPDREAEEVQYNILSYLQNISPDTQYDKYELSKEATELHFGFVPNSKTDYEKFYSILEKDDDFPLTKELATGIFHHYLQYSEIFTEAYLASDMRYMYNKNNISGVFAKTNEAEGFTSFAFEFEITNPPSFPYTVTIRYKNTKPDMTEVFKIINSIENN